MSGLSQQIEGLVGSLRGLFEPKRTRRTGTIVHIQRDGPDGSTGRPMYAVMQIGESANEIVPVGNAMAVHTGDVWSVTGSGDPAAPEWRLDIRQQSAAPAMGADLEQDRVSLVIPTYADPDDLLSQPIGAISEEMLNSLTGPNGSPLAQVRVFYRTIVPGSYSVYGGAENVKQVDLYLRKTSDENYGAPAGSTAVWPTRPVHVILAASLAASGLSVSVNLPGDITINDIISNYHVYWRLKDEVAIAKLVDTGGGAYELQFTSDGRGVESTTAVAHASSVKAELLCGRVSAGGLEPGQSYKLYIQSGTGYGVPGDKSNEVTFTSWQRTTLPAVGTCTVEQREGGAYVSWTRPVSGGLPLTHVYYKVYRNTSATTSGATTVEGRVDALTAFVQGSNGSGNFYGVQVLDTMGNESAVTWGSDTAAPPHPSGRAWLVWSDETTVYMEYQAANDANGSRADSGFKEFVLYRATGSVTAPTNATEVGSFTANSFNYTPPQDQAYLFQVAARDWAGNVSSRVNDDTHWFQIVPTDYGATSYFNGNLQKPGPVRTVSDTQTTASSAVVTSSTARFRSDDLGQLVKIADAGVGGADYYGFIWEVTSATSIKVQPAVTGTTSNKAMVVGGLPDGWVIGVREFPVGTSLPVSSTYNGTYSFANVKSVEYLTTGGVRGSRALKIVFRNPAIAYGTIQFYSTRVFHINQNTTSLVNAGWCYASSTNAWLVNGIIDVSVFDDDFGQDFNTDGSAVSGIAAIDLDSWTQFSLNIIGITAVGANSYRLGIGFQIAPLLTGTDTEVIIDDFTLTAT